MSQEFTHLDENGNAVMVDVSGKPVTSRIAVAEGRIFVSSEVMNAVRNGTAKKGDVLGVSRVAGIQGAKQTSSLIPLCHPLLIQKCSVDFETDPEQGCITAVCTVRCAGQTGVEMEALTGVSTALLTIYDMCKAMDRSMEISDIRLLEKDGGRSGHYVRRDPAESRAEADDMAEKGK